MGAVPVRARGWRRNAASALLYNLLKFTATALRTVARRVHPAMANPLKDLMANLELSLVETVDRLEQAEMHLLYVGVLDLEQRIAALHDALAFVADGVADRTGFLAD